MASIKTTVGHLVFLIHDFEKNIEIYKKLFNYLEYKILMDESYGLGVMAPNDMSLWVMAASVEKVNERDSNGLNHIAFHVEKKEDVDTFVEEFLKQNSIEPLFETPRSRPDFTGDKGMYYQVMFELPGAILCEVVYTVYE